MARTAATSQALRENFAHCISTDRERFDRAPLPYPFKFEQQVDEFAAAVQVAVDGEVVRACNLIISMDHEPLVKWFDTLAQNAGRERVRFLGNTPSTAAGAVHVTCEYHGYALSQNAMVGDVDTATFEWLSHEYFERLMRCSEEKFSGI